MPLVSRYKSLFYGGKYSRLCIVVIVDINDKNGLVLKIMVNAVMEISWEIMNWGMWNGSTCGTN